MNARPNHGGETMSTETTIECALCAAYGCETFTEDAEAEGWSRIRHDPMRDGARERAVWACPGCVEAGAVTCDEEDAMPLTLSTLTEIMSERKREHAPGSECVCWQEYVKDCDRVLGCMPWDENRGGDVVPAAFAEYWTERRSLRERWAR
jgi:hypothetical protein